MNCARDLVFEITSTRTVDNTAAGKKYVAYTITVRSNGAIPDPSPASVERRYTDFLELYNQLRQEFPSVINSLVFPKKALVGNFDAAMIAARSMGFESLLAVIARNQKLKESKSVSAFFQGPEMQQAKQLICTRSFAQARPLLENCFRVLNKMQTDRDPEVMRSLCLLVACCVADKDTNGALQLVDVALHRYQAISDADLLRYYVPLLQLSCGLYQTAGRGTEHLELQLADFKRRGMKVEGPTLLDAVISDIA